MSDFIITQEMIDTCREHGACSDGIAWAEKNLGKMPEIDHRGAQYLLWASRYVEIPDDVLDACSERDQWASLRYAADKLTPTRLDWCAERLPSIAMKYTADRLTHERRAWCEKKMKHEMSEQTKSIVRRAKQYYTCKWCNKCIPKGSCYIMWDETPNDYTWATIPDERFVVRMHNLCNTMCENLKSQLARFDKKEAE